MKNVKLFLLIALTFVGLSSFAGAKIKLTSGSLAGLKGKTILVKFDYDGMAVGKFANESDYIAKKKGEYNAKEAGRGDQWEKSWKSDRAARFEPKFMELLSKYAEKSGIKFVTSGSGDYTMNVKTTRTEPGYNVYVSRAPALINTVSTITNASGEVAKITVTNATGSTFGGYDFDTGVRITEAYALTGKVMGGLFSKMCK
ncbi:MAG: hypothetical protein WCP57_06050 [Bacteroidota bacterium]